VLHPPKNILNLLNQLLLLVNLPASSSSAGSLASSTYLWELDSVLAYL
jgi:hypothetical protein